MSAHHCSRMREKLKSTLPQGSLVPAMEAGPGTSCAHTASGRSRKRPHSAMYAKAVGLKTPTRSQRERPLRSLRALVARVPSEHRRLALQQLPKPVREALLQHLEAAASSPGKTALAARMSGHKAPAQPAHRTAPAVPKSISQSKPPIKGDGGVARKLGGYIAHTHIAPYLSVVTRCQATAQRAEQFREVLARAKDMIAGALGPAEELQSQHLSSAIQAACAEKGLSAELLGLSFCALVPAHAVVGCTVAGSYSTCLEEALEQRRQLLSARGQDWGKLRTAWMQVLQMRVQGRSWGRSYTRPQAKTVEEAAEIVDSAWRAHEWRRRCTLEAQRARICSRLQPLIMRAAAAVQAALDIERQQRAKKKVAPVASQETARQPKERRRWAEDRHLTMDEILRGREGSGGGGISGHHG
eukprot:gnl/TRDRNA2_/TRDRNA2_34516_c0_seq1.p1 gnl/TRDRNA2_/TRDRNA2_34516_c0~~gnl/TRDRNA2_/TRDRNA2_34516_c0_seq1.p1  ORF type:complete len:413 (+),score=65.37 gnl/TRDRNA2_/TRDRNA2_34516_c0_seq1:104-1342(+)